MKTTTNKTTKPKPNENDHEDEQFVHMELARIALAHRPALKYDGKGRITFVNAPMAQLMGATPEQLMGRHHDEVVKRCSESSEEIWNTIQDGRFWTGDYAFSTKAGAELCVVTQYYPLVRDGRLVTVVHFMTDVTNEAKAKADHRGQLQAIDRSLGVVQFDLDGHVTDANENFLAAVGYRRDEVVGRHHRILVRPEYAASEDYAAFWATLRSGQHHAGVFERVGKGGQPVWIQASYNPIFDPNGRLVKLLKFATDITQRVEDASALADGVSQLMGFSSNLNQLSSSMMESANETAEQANSSAAAAEQVNENVRTVAAAVEEMKASVREIASNASHAVSVAEKASSSLRDVTSNMSQLKDSSDKIGTIVKVVKAIAEQTNLLALNATIEAARAGEAGKGFAVVASEVKQLAKQTSTATEDISNWIDGIQAATKSTYASIDHVDGVVKNICETQSAIASAVEEQTSTNNEIARALHEAAMGVEGISEVVASLADMAQKSSRDASETSAAAEQLAMMADGLRPLIERSDSRSTKDADDGAKGARREPTASSGPRSEARAP